MQVTIFVTSTFDPATPHNSSVYAISILYIERLCIKKYTPLEAWYVSWLGWWSSGEVRNFKRKCCYIRGIGGWWRWWCFENIFFWFDFSKQFTTLAKPTFFAVTHCKNNNLRWWTFFASNFTTLTTPWKAFNNNNLTSNFQKKTTTYVIFTETYRRHSYRALLCTPFSELRTTSIHLQMRLVLPYFYANNKNLLLNTASSTRLNSII